jgi:hypothetical protein
MMQQTIPFLTHTPRNIYLLLLQIRYLKFLNKIVGIAWNSNNL